MKTEEFKEWLELRYDDPKTVSSRISNCKKVEQYYGSLDDHYIKDGLNLLTEKLTYTKDDNQEKRETKHIIPINGNKLTGSATYKQAIGLYIQFSEVLAEEPIDIEHVINEELETIKKVINNFLYSKSIYVKKFKKQHKVDAKVLQNDILVFLREHLNNYNWQSEYKDKNWSNGERIDIYGACGTKNYDIVIELDAHRADQVAKKFVSRMAMFLNKKIIYIPICYTGTNKMNKKECYKYFTYCELLAMKLPDTLFYGKIFE